MMKKQLILLLVISAMTGNIDAAASRFYNWCVNNRSRLGLLSGAALSSGAAAYYWKSRNQPINHQLQYSRGGISDSHIATGEELGIQGIIPLPLKDHKPESPTEKEETKRPGRNYSVPLKRSYFDEWDHPYMIIDIEGNSERLNKPYWDNQSQKWVDPSNRNYR